MPSVNINVALNPPERDLNVSRNKTVYMLLLLVFFFYNARFVAASDSHHSSVFAFCPWQVHAFIHVTQRQLRAN